jgi:hypothetical protein
MNDLQAKLERADDMIEMLQNQLRELGIPLSFWTGGQAPEYLASQRSCPNCHASSEFSSSSKQA